MFRPSATYRGFKLEIEACRDAFIAHVVSLTSGARFIASGLTAFAAAESAFDLIDDLLTG
jgi:hypothetical protein